MQEYVYGAPNGPPPVLALPRHYAHYAETLRQNAPLDYSNLIDINGQPEERVVEPTPLIVEVQHLIKDYPRRILDVGAHVGKHSIYLAAQGHHVTAIDHSQESIDYAQESVRQLGIPQENIKLVRADAADYLSSTDKFDVVLANMVLHFLKPDKAVQTIKLVQQVTADNGINCVSNFTHKNPEQEKEKSGRHYLVSAGELASMYSPTAWKVLLDFTGDAPKYLTRNPREGKLFIPHISELIAAKHKAAAPQLGRTMLQGMDPEYWRRSDPELYQFLMESRN